VKLFNRFPTQRPFESIDELATFVAVQLDIEREQLGQYALQQWTFSHHQEAIREYLQVQRFDETAETLLKNFLFKHSQQIQSIESLLIKAIEFLKEQQFLNPSEDTIERIIQTEREKARKYVFEKIYTSISPSLQHELDSLLFVGDGLYSTIYQIKDVPKIPSAKAMKLLAAKLDMIEQTGVNDVNLDWLNNNYKRYLSCYVTRCDAKRLRELEPRHRYASLVCFLQEAYRDSKDHIFDMYQKAINAMYNKADKAVDNYNRSKRTTTRACLINHKKLCSELLAVSGGRETTESLLKKFPQAQLQIQIGEVESLLGSKYSNSLNVVADRFSHMRQMARPLLEKLTLELAPTGNNSLLSALQLLRELSEGKRRRVPENTSLDFLPKSLRLAVRENGVFNQKRFEAAGLTAIRDQIKCGNLAVLGSKRFGKLEDFFISDEEWATLREEFFKKNGLPQNPQDVPAYLDSRLQIAFDYFLSREKSNEFARIEKEGWVLSKDPAEELSASQKQALEKLKNWLARNMRIIKLPDLLIEVDNDLHFTDPYLPATRRKDRNPDDICSILTVHMCYGCNIGPQIMPQIIPGISYHQIKRMFDWQVTDEANSLALASIVNGIGGVEVTKAWGDGRTAGADGQRLGYHRKTLHRTFSHKFNDFALEFYTFVADNYAPFYNLVKEPTERDSSRVLDGHLYNVSDLDPEEWYYDTGGYDEINFAAFQMYGKQFCPRIRNIKTQWLYKIDDTKDYGNLNKLLKGAKHTIKMNAIVDQWDRMGQFYASLEAGRVTASTALRRLTGFTEKNTFYKASRELGRIFKTEDIMYWMTDPQKRKRTRKGLLKVEQIHQLIRDITYGNRGRLKGKSMEDINSSSNLTILIIAAIIYWQAKEISNVIKEHDPEAEGIDLSLLAHVSPIEWTNVILYGEYKLDRTLIK